MNILFLTLTKKYTAYGLLKGRILMPIMQEALLTVLRDKTTSRTEFRQAAKALGYLLAGQAADHVATRQIQIQTPIAATTGITLNNVILVPILRSGIVLLDPFYTYFPQARVGVVGIRRKEVTAEPIFYYDNMPPMQPSDQIIILDPMLATGGTAITVLNVLKSKGIAENKILFVGIVCSPEGLEKVQKLFPGVTFLISAHDQHLNSAFFIVPGLGDFGDRYFGTE